MNTKSLRTAAVTVLAVLGLAVAAGCATPAASGANPAAAGAGVAGAGAAGQPGAQPAAAQNVGAATPTPPYAGQRTISVTGVGTVTGTPDTLTVQLGVQTRAATASAALAENNTKANALIAALTTHGVATKDLQTSQLSINPVYSGGTEATITGYEVSNSVTATLHDISKAGAVIDAAGQAAGDAIRLNSVGFSFGDDSALRAQARADAMKQALAQAKQLADAAGVAVGQVLSISESATVSGPQPMYAMPEAAGGADMLVLAGQQDLTVTVQVVVGIG